MIDLALSPEDEQKRNQTMQMQQAPLAQVQSPQPQQKGMAGQMGDMVKQKLMSDAAGAGAKAITAGAKQGMSSMLAPTVGSAIEGGSVLGPMAGGGGMAAIGTAMPYVGAGLLAGKALGLFNEGGMVGPLSAQYNYGGGMAGVSMSGGGVDGYSGDGGFIKEYITNPANKLYNMYFPYEGEDLSYDSSLPDPRGKYSNSPAVAEAKARAKKMGTTIDPRAYGTQYNAQGTMSKEQAMALMNNQPEPIQTMPPTSMPMMRINPDDLYNEIMAESMTEAAQQAMPMMRPPLGADPLNADTTYSPYDMIRPDNAPNT